MILASEQSRYDLLSIHAATFLVLLAVAYTASRDTKALAWRLPQPAVLPNLLLILSIGGILLHWVELGGIPAMRALASTDYVEIVKLRQSITERSALFNYGSGFLIRVMLPLFVLRYVLQRQYWVALLVALIGVAYGLSLMQKSYPIFIVAPSLVYLTFTQRRAAIVCGIVAFVCVAALVSITNVGLRPGEFSDVPGAFRAATIVVTSLAERVLVVPGQVVGDWLNAFPAIFPFEHGCGYRFLSTVLGCEFINNSILMYQHYFPENAAQGILGTYNAAHFAEEYANFGPLGLVVSAVLANAVLFAAAWATAGRDTATIVAINFPFIASLSSAALQTTLVSGGWLAMVALSLVLLPRLEADASAHSRLGTPNT